MEEIISKDILIIGAQRCGKSSVANFISKKYNQYEILRGDPAMIAVSELMKYNVYNNANIDEGDIVALNVSDIYLDNEQKMVFYKSFYSQIKIDLTQINKNIIMETMDIEPKEAVENFSESCDIYCFGMPNEDPENLAKIFCTKDKPYDWTYYSGKIGLKIICNSIINYSKELFEECQKYNIKFFDTSGNRENKLKEAIKIIEEKSIN